MPTVPGPAAGQARLSWAERIWLGFLGGPGYRRLGAQPAGAYAAFLTVAVAAAVALAVISGLVASRTLSALLQAWRQLPAFSVTDAGLVLPRGVSPPVRVSADGAVIVLDDSPQAGADLLGAAQVGLLLTGQEVVIRQGEVGDRVLPLQALGPPPVTKETLGALLRQLAGPGLWLAGVLSVIYQVGRDFVRAAVIAWFGLTMARLRGLQPSWAQAWRVGLAAWTLPLLAEVGRLWIAYPSWALWVVACIYATIGCYHQTPEGGAPGPPPERTTL